MAEPPSVDTLRPESTEEGSIRAYLALIWGRKLLILAVTAVVASGSALWTYRQTRIYRASTALIIDQHMPRILDNKVSEVVDISPYAYRDTADYMKTQVTIACSTKVAELAADRLKLHRNEKFWLGRKQIPAAHRTPHMAALWLSGMVRCSSRMEASIIDISVEHASPEMAARLSGVVAQAYIDHNLEHKLASTHGAVKWLSEQLGDLKEQLGEAEGELYRYRKDNDLISLTLTDRQTLLSKQLSDLTEQWSEARNKRFSLSALVAQVKVLPLKDLLAVPELPIFRTKVVEQLKLEVLAEQQRYMELSTRYLTKHPLVAAQKVKLDQVRADLRKQLRAAIAGAVKRLQQAHSNETMLAAALNTTKEEAFETNKREMAYRRLERNAKGAEKLYGIVLGRMTESGLTAKLRANNVRLLEPARVPGAPIRPRTRLNLMVGLLLGLLSGILLVFLLEAFDNSVLGQEDIEAEGAVFLGSLPLIEGVSAADRQSGVVDHEVRELMAQYKPRSQHAEDCRAIRTNLLFASPDRPLKKLLVTGATPGDGKTMTATSLAITMAQRGSRVLIIDADMRRPSLHQVFGVPLQDGLTSALQEDADADPFLLTKSTGIDGLSLLTAGTLPPNPAELCHSERLHQVIDKLTDGYDVVVLDSPPVISVTDAVVLSTICDGALLVARSGQTSKDELRQALRRLWDVGAPVLGCVVNGIDLLGKSYKYRYRYSRLGASQYAYNYAPRGDGPSSDA